MDFADRSLVMKVVLRWAQIFGALVSRDMRLALEDHPQEWTLRWNSLGSYPKELQCRLRTPRV